MVPVAKAKTEGLPIKDGRSFHERKRTPTREVKQRAVIPAYRWGSIKKKSNEWLVFISERGFCTDKE